MDTLVKYTRFGSFTFLPLPKRKECFKNCNAPSDASGVYLIYGIDSEKEELVYIGSSGKRLPAGNIKVRKSRPGMGGIKGRLIQGSQNNEPRHKFWKKKMLIEGFKELRINWYVTYETEFTDCPVEVETTLIKMCKPKWNKK